MKFALIHVGQETCDFNPVPTTLRDFRSFGLFEGAEVIEKSRGIGQVGGYIEAVERSGRAIETIAILRAWAGAGGRITTEARAFFEDRIRAGLAKAGRHCRHRKRSK